MLPAVALRCYVKNVALTEFYWENIFRREMQTSIENQQEQLCYTLRKGSLRRKRNNNCKNYFRKMQGWKMLTMLFRI